MPPLPAADRRFSQSFTRRSRVATATAAEDCVGVVHGRCRLGAPCGTSRWSAGARVVMMGLRSPWPVVVGLGAVGVAAMVAERRGDA